MNYKKLLLHFIIFLLAFGTSLIPTYYYGKIKHDRYYDVTILAVQKNQIKLMISILEQFKKENILNRDLTVNDIKEAFSPMERYTLIKVKDKFNKEMFLFKTDYYPIRNENYKEFKIDGLTITFGTYQGLEWNKQFIPWLKMILPLDNTDIKKIQDSNGKYKSVYNWWYDYKSAYKRYDFITDPFIFFLFMSYIGIFLSVVVYTQHRYFKDISNTLEKLKRETVE